MHTYAKGRKISTRKLEASGRSPRKTIDLPGSRESRILGGTDPQTVNEHDDDDNQGTKRPREPRVWTTVSRHESPKKNHRRRKNLSTLTLNPEDLTLERSLKALRP